VTAENREIEITTNAEEVERLVRDEIEAGRYIVEAFMSGMTGDGIVCIQVRFDKLAGLHLQNGEGAAQFVPASLLRLKQGERVTEFRGAKAPDNASGRLCWKLRYVCQCEGDEE
jgi:hypothetical protein